MPLSVPEIVSTGYEGIEEFEIVWPFSSFNVTLERLPLDPISTSMLSTLDTLLQFLPF